MQITRPVPACRGSPDQPEPPGCPVLAGWGGHPITRSCVFPFSRQVARRVVSLAVELGYLFAECGAVIPSGIGEQPGLPLVVPTLGIQALSLFEMKNRFSQITGPIKMLP